MTSGFFTGNLLRGLAARVLLFLSLALLPIGLIAIIQTRELSDQARENGKLSLLAVTERITAVEERVLQEAFGAAQALGRIVAINLRNDANCSAFLREYKRGTDSYSLVGFLDLDGQMACSSIDRPMDFSQNTDFQKLSARHARQAILIDRPVISDRPVTMVTVPAYNADVHVGYMAMSIPYDAFARVTGPEAEVEPLALFTFNADGDILTTEKERAEVIGEIPADVSLAAFSGERTSVFHAVNEEGENRAYAILPLVPDAVYAMSVWPADTPILRSALATRLSAFLPVLMWISSLIVAFWALNRLAITHIRKLGRQMRRFAINRKLPANTMSPSVPSELVEMERAFFEMAESILRDEAILEDSLREKNILLKEVHHRVKNNLQLISSIMNMQIRQAKGDDAKFVLKRLQERILSLATVHENMYKNDNLTRVDAKVLLNASVNQLLTVGLEPSSGLRVRQHYAPIMLEPDDAAPLTLLTSEAVTNALKYVSAPPGEAPLITIKLCMAGDHDARLTVENSAYAPPTAQGTGLGSKLILAFTRQLDGTVETTEEAGVYRVAITFPVPQSDKPVYDY